MTTRIGLMAKNLMIALLITTQQKHVLAMKLGEIFAKIILAMNGANENSKKKVYGKRFVEDDMGFETNKRVGSHE